MVQRYIYSVNETTTLMIFGPSLWLKVYEHNASENDYFTSIEQVAYVNQKNMFSILGSINNSFKVGGYYEFFYEVPGYQGYNRWKQKLHPFETSDDTTIEEIGFKPVKLTWTEPIFGGISKSQSPATFFNGDGYGDYESWWWYPIGPKQSDTNYPGTIPACYPNQAPANIMWVRLPTTTGRLEKIRTCEQVHYKPMSYLVSVTLSLLISLEYHE